MTLNKRKPKELGYGQIKKSGSIGSILSRLYAQIRFDLGITPSRYSDLMERYIRRATLSPGAKEKAAIRATLSKELLKDYMSWKTFVKGILFFQVLKFDITMTLYHRNNTVTTHTITVIADEINEDEKDESNTSQQE